MNTQAVVVIVFLMIVYANGFPAGAAVKDSAMHDFEDTRLKNSEDAEQDGTENTKQDGIRDIKEDNIETKLNVVRVLNKDFEIDVLVNPVQIEFRRERKAEQLNEDAIENEEEELMEGAETIIFRPLFSYRRDSASRRRF